MTLMRLENLQPGLEQRLDLGIVDIRDKGILNQGLYTFKTNLGCIDSERITWQKML